MSSLMAGGKTFPLATALRAAFAGGYDLDTLRRDATAALIVSLVALPLAMALSIAVGLPPQNGLYTAIAAGAVVPLIDMSGLVAMKGLILDLEAQHRRIILCGRGEVTDSILKKLPDAARGDVRVVATLEDAAGLVAA